ncbi:hypothetical protein GCM10007103_08550 [Salinimicrobium marinum]|uniref:Uncharacterized protein n=1 Tax=Salinimicrobium marinum TaxID=680283 RepID=A0A918VVV8_9FLAO|nr:hypothetical protein GCM10007103_08550 [Salinimicrobium marinum]
MQSFRFLVYLLEAVAAVAGFYYLLKKPENKPVRNFVYFLLFTFFIETIGHIPLIIYRNESLYFLKNTFLGNNYWLFNPYLILNFLVYVSFFKWNLSRKHFVKILNISLSVYLLVTVLNLLFTDVFFVTNSALTYLGGTLLLLVAIFMYYYELLTSSRILEIKREVSFYISVGALFFYLIVSPVFIYFRYFNTQSPGFVQLSTYIMIAANIFMYTCFTFGFILCSRKKNLSSLYTL